MSSPSNPSPPPASPPADVPALLERALALHRQGRLADAQTAYRQILQADPGHADSLHLLGLIAHQSGDLAQAAELIGRAVSVQPGNAAFHGNLGAVLHELGRFEEALAHSERALALQPGHAQAHANRGRSLQALGRCEDAVASYDLALRQRPGDAELHHRRALALQQLGRFEEAALGHGEAVLLAPGHGDAHFQRGNALRSMGRLPAALASYDQAIAVRADDAEALCNRGNVLQELGRFDAALMSYEHAIAAHPAYVEAHFNRGIALKALGRLDEAIASYDRALAVDPGYVPAHMNRGLAFQDLNRVDDALACFDRVLELRPDDAKASWNKAWGLLLTGRLEQGWPLYERGWAAGERGDARNFTQPLWLGREPLVGRTILLHAEQGLGDTLQFCRYATQVAALGGRVLLEVPRPLVRIMRSLAGVDQVVEAGAPLPHFDLHCPLLSLPLAFGTRLDSIPFPSPYLRCDAETVARWAPQLASSTTSTRRRIGIAWSGSTWGRNPLRSLTLAQVLPSLPPEFDYVVLQKDVREVDRELLRAQPNFEVHADAIGDFSDTAALCESVERVISVDTSVAHLAGALGKPTWILLPFAADWRWLLDRADSPWYPGVATLHRQHAPFDWTWALARLLEDLTVGQAGFGFDATSS
jgi:tetratricopeptide (TPR) repeat protein